MTGSFVQAQLKIHANELFTGIFHLKGREQFILFLVKGAVTACYRFESEGWASLNASLWTDAVASASGDLRILHLPDDGLRAFHLLLESEFSESRSFPAISGNELISQLSTRPRDEKAGLALLKMDHSTGILLLPASGADVAECLLVSGTEFQNGLLAINQARAWNSCPVELMLYSHTPHSESWMEYDLRHVFIQFTQKALSRYEVLAGKFLVSNLGEQVNIESRNHDWAITLFGQNLTVRQYFENANKAGRAYASILDVIGWQMDSVVGKKVAGDILTNAAAQLPSEMWNLMHAHVLSRLSTKRIVRIEEASHD